MRKPRGPTVLVVLLVCTSSFTLAENVDPDDDDSQYAWAENVGWLNAEPAGCTGCGVQVSDFSLTGYLWSENTGWINLSCQNNSTCGNVDYGVTNDGHGNLGGFAWSENSGWINFAPSTSNAAIDPVTGEFSGYAWAENLGWISLSCANSGTCLTNDYGIKTDWCQSVLVPPAGTPFLTAGKTGTDIDLDWSALAGADWYEVVQGDLSTLASSGGDYMISTSQCAVDNESGTATSIAGTPPVNDGFWFLVRGVNCRGKGGHDSGGAGQSGPRDPGIAASGNDCQ